MLGIHTTSNSETKPLSLPLLNFPAPSDRLFLPINHTAPYHIYSNTGNTEKIVDEDIDDLVEVHECTELRNLNPSPPGSLNLKVQCPTPASSAVLGF